jgi:hypothetical protein
MKVKSGSKRPRWEPPKNQVGDGTTLKLRSITTPKREWYLMDAIAEWIIVQRYGFKNVPPYFWTKKAKVSRLRNEFLAIKKMMFGMIKRKPGITAFQLIIPVLKQYKCLIKEEEVEQVLVNAEEENANGDTFAEEALIELTTKQKPANVFQATQHLGEGDGTKEEDA